MPKNRNIQKRVRRAFTLLEMMLVVVIIGLLMSVAVINLTGRSTETRIATTQQTLSTVKSAITNYFNQNGSYPATLSVLVPRDLEKLPRDAWKEDLVYFLTPGDANHMYALYSKGADKQANSADDISVWAIGD